MKKRILETIIAATCILLAYNGNTWNIGDIIKNQMVKQKSISGNMGLVISEDGLRIQKSDGSDWFWLGDTGWSLFQELNREEAELYFSKRVSQGFNVIQAVLVMGWNRDWNEENAYGHCPFIDGNINKPNEEFWKHADWLINKAREHELYIALMPAWGSYWGRKADVEYARWITNRYKECDNIIWVNGGDRKVRDDKELFIQIGNEYNRDEDALITFHPATSEPSSNNFHNENWLDFNMQQSGHGRRDIRADHKVDLDLSKSPVKPTINGEPNYEDHCVAWDKNCAQGTFNAHDVRQLAYWTVFAGATGYTYGHVHVWDFYHNGNEEDGCEDWKVQLNDSGAVQMAFLKNLIMSRPHSGKSPAQHILKEESPDGIKQRAIMGDGYAFVYTSQGQNILINLDELPWEQNNAWWYNPRDGKATGITKVPNNGNYIFDPPGDSGDDNDWVLVIDEASKGYAKPGRVKYVQ